jgi:hypothetical protein
MAAPEKNKYWQFRNKHGRDHKYTPMSLEEESVKYFEWNEANPLYESVLVARGIVIDKGKPNEKTVYSTTMPKMRAMTIAAFCLYADICEKTFSNYRNDKDFLQVVTRIEQTIYAQKFEGAAATLLNPNIIARDLGLADKQHHESPDGSMSAKPMTAKRAKELDEMFEDEY